MPETCDCSHETGPCYEHGTVLVVREGASLRTADGLALVRVNDCTECGAVLSSRDVAELKRLEGAERAGGWFANPDDQEAAFDLADHAEGGLPDHVRVYANDGYVIVRLHDDCPLLED
jgi:hypothetical protein